MNQPSEDTLEALLARLDDERLTRVIEDEDAPEADLRRLGELYRSATEPAVQDASEELRAGRVAQRILARTTGHVEQEQGVLDFFAERLRRSMLLRVAAALLVVQLTLVPLVAWHLLRQPEEPGLKFRFEPVPEELVDEIPPAAERQDVGGGIETLEGFSEAPDAEDTTSLRALLWDDPVFVSLAPGMEDDLWWALVGLLVDRDQRSGWGELYKDAGSSARSWWAWSRLLRYEATGSTRGLARSLEALEGVSDAASPEIRALARRALTHAAALGLAIPGSSTISVPNEAGAASIAELMHAAALTVEKPNHLLQVLIQRLGKGDETHRLREGSAR